MADEPQNTPAPAATPPDASIPATPQSDPTPTQTDSQKFNAALDAEIDDLWAKVEGRAPQDDQPEPQTADESAPGPAKAEAPKPDAPKAETPPSTPEIDRNAIEREAEERARARIAEEQRIQQETERRVRAEAEHRRAAEAYVGSDDDYQAVNLAMRQAYAGDPSALNSLDVVLPNGQKVSQVKGTRGLTEEEAANLLTAWDTSRKFETVIGDRKVQHLVDLWNADIMRTLSHPDVDASAVTKHSQPHQQMEALRDSVIANVTKRLGDQHAEVVKAKDAEIKKQADRIESLLVERGNLAPNRAAASAATVDRPGQPGAVRPSVPTPEELAEMPFDQAFKSGAIDRVLQSLPGGLSTPRRRAG